MTQVTPPGWYPDPGQTSDGPRAERWWDGRAWTEQVRPAGATDGGAGYGFPAGVSPVPPERPRRGWRTAVGAGVALVLLACVAGGAYVLGNDEDRSGAPTAGERSGPDDPERPVPREEKGYVTDSASGISLPVPDGWSGESGMVGAEITIGRYPCPGNPEEQCVRGGAFSAPAAAMKLTQDTPKEAAEADIARNAKDSYGGPVYGGIASHDELAAKSVEVAGEQGYLVRWKVVTYKGDDGYVESLAFPSPADSKTLVVVRFGFDVNDRAPKLETMDEITRGIKAAPLGGGGGGNGREV